MAASRQHSGVASPSHSPYSSSASHQRQEQHQRQQPQPSGRKQLFTEKDYEPFQTLEDAQRAWATVSSIVRNSDRHFYETGGQQLLSYAEWEEIGKWTMWHEQELERLDPSPWTLLLRKLGLAGTGMHGG